MVQVSSGSERSVSPGDVLQGFAHLGGPLGFDVDDCMGVGSDVEQWPSGYVRRLGGCFQMKRGFLVAERLMAGGVSAASQFVSH